MSEPLPTPNGKSLAAEPSRTRVLGADLLERVVLIVAPFAYWIDRLGLTSAFAALLALVGGRTIFLAVASAGRPRPAAVLGLTAATTCVAFIYLWAYLYWGTAEDIYYVRFFLTPFVLVAVLSLRSAPSREVLRRYVGYVMVVNVAVLGIEALLVNAHILPVSISPAYHTTYSYQSDPGTYQKPFGLTGNFSVNGTTSAYLVFLYSFFCQATGRPLRWTMLAIGVFGVVFAGSGQGYVALGTGVALYNLASRQHRLRSLLTLGIIGVGGAWIVVSGHFTKLSLPYLRMLYVLVTETFVPFMSSHLTWKIFFFGAPSPDWPIDVFVFYVIGNFGFIFFCLYWILVFWGLLAYHHRSMVTAAVVLFVGSLHYPTAFYFHIQLITAMVIVHGISAGWRACAAVAPLGLPPLTV